MLTFFIVCSVKLPHSNRIIHNTTIKLEAILKTECIFQHFLIDGEIFSTENMKRDKVKNLCF